ncbi:MAG: outer membrane beta-barrel protein [Bacteroidetes bacterium]|nr:outer membrane beta-barrel protein [Bacteroidota bacterium]
MKKIIILLFILTAALNLFGQQNDTTEIRISERDLLKVVETNDGTKIYLRGKEIFNVTDINDSTTVAIGHKKLIISETSDKTLIEVVDERSNKRNIIYDERNEYADQEYYSPNDTTARNDANAAPDTTEQPDHDYEKDEYAKDPPRRWSDFEEFDDQWKHKSDKSNEFKGHWFSFDWGFNNYLNPDGSISRNASNQYMDLNTGRSWNFNINFSQYSIGIIKDRAGFVTGLGIEINNYHFDGENNITKQDGKIVPDYRFATANIEIKKNRFATTYITVPLLFETQLTGGDPDDRLYVSFGVIGGIRIGNNIKVKYFEDGRKKKYKERGDDFNINTFRYGVTAKAGYKSFSVFSRYYLTPLFEKNNGPELYPLSAGLTLNL